jgi:hypothetical protein
MDEHEAKTPMFGPDTPLELGLSVLAKVDNTSEDLWPFFVSWQIAVNKKVDARRIVDPSHWWFLAPCTTLPGLFNILTQCPPNASAAAHFDFRQSMVSLWRAQDFASLNIAYETQRSKQDILDRAQMRTKVRDYTNEVESLGFAQSG